MQRHEKSPLGIAEKKIKEITDLADKHVFSKLPPLDIPKLMEDPTIKTISNIAQNEKLQETFQKIVADAPKIGDQIKDGLDKVGNLFKP